MNYHGQGLLSQFDIGFVSCVPLRGPDNSGEC